MRAPEAGGGVSASADLASGLRSLSSNGGRLKEASKSKQSKSSWRIYCNEVLAAIGQDLDALDRCNRLQAVRSDDVEEISANGQESPAAPGANAQKAAEAAAAAAAAVAAEEALAVAAAEAAEAALAALQQDAEVMRRNLVDYDIAIRATIGEAERLRAEVTSLERHSDHVGERMQKLLLHQATAHDVLHRENAELAKQNEALLQRIHSALDARGDIERDSIIQALFAENSCLWLLVQLSDAARTAAEERHPSNGQSFHASATSSPHVGGRSGSRQPSASSHSARTRTSSGSSPSIQSLPLSPPFAGFANAGLNGPLASPRQSVPDAQGARHALSTPPRLLSPDHQAQAAAGGSPEVVEEGSAYAAALPADDEDDVAPGADAPDTSCSIAADVEEDDFSEVSSLVESAIVLASPGRGNNGSQLGCDESSSPGVCVSSFAAAIAQQEGP